MRVTRYFLPFSRVVQAMVHPCARRDPLQAALHATFIATRLIAVAVAAISLPVYLAVWGAPDALAAICFAWLAAPMAVAFYLSRTGRLWVAHVMSAASMALLILVLATWTGGMASPFLPWLAAVPAEAALSGSGMIVLLSIAVSGGALIGMTAAEAVGAIPAATADPGATSALGLIGVLPILAFVGLMTGRAWSLARRAAAVERAGHDRLRRIANAASDAILTLRRNGNVTFATDAAEAIFSVPGAALCGDGLFARVHVADRPGYLTTLDVAAAGGAASTELRIDAAPSGVAADYVWVEMRCRPLVVGEGGSPDIVAVISRIGSRKQAEGELRLAQEEAERANLAKGRFLASMSHELRTPLNAILGFSDILRTGADEGRGTDGVSGPAIPVLDDEKRREYASLIHESGVHLLEVVNDILDMSKIDSGHFEIFPESLDVVELVETCRRMVADQVAQAGLRIETDLPHSVSKISADPRASKQIVLNLLTNAVKFSRRGGRIVVGAYREDRSVVLYVADEGVGIARCDVPRLGEPFCQLDSGYERRHQGTGLGLSVVKGLVALHGGTMEIDSELGVGTRILIRLPEIAATATVADRPGVTEMPYKLIA
ncbi:PAS domain-containing sensor histidine kinase [Microbaculum marinum]|uniref:histidine kinase n=1 Tax=Microbaculum marinum TaxID=1764581 RepID=A0AAW9RUY9_9HYPH